MVYLFTECSPFILCALCVLRVLCVSAPNNGETTMTGAVRSFERREIADALLWAREGGIALHFFRWSHPRYGTGEYCHVLCANRDRLIAFGSQFSFSPLVLQPPRPHRPGIWHYDAYGWRVLALRRLVAIKKGQ